ncbi:calmodulin-related protein, putative [Bodo saltans]|uniref:Calmodulin-related protein, putative n=1 Tax=Bodo saltans TaxID=75058 RepID=A0A0S4JKD9_BODSA|nr:calmodulin-related protein, putative [Bodo saltans]|eukprot:CUG91038.1 calmodulin-related protein, putative [Bodo saltans]
MAEVDERPVENVQEEADPTVSAIIRNLSSDEIDMLRDAFIHMDRDSDGFVGLEEMMASVRFAVGDERYPALRSYLEPMFHVADKDKDSRLSLTEFLSSFAEGPGVVPADVINQCVSSIRVRLSDEEIAALQENFFRIDKNQDGYIDRDELTVALKEILLAKFPDLTDHTFGEIVTVVLASADSDNDGKLSLSEFIRSFQEDQGVLPAAFIDVRAQHVARQLTKEEVEVLKDAFAALDKNNDGFVDFVEMYQALWETLENSIQDKNQVRELCELIMVTADRNQKGMLTLTDFIRNFVQNLDLMKIPVAAAQDKIRKSRDTLRNMFDSGALDKLVQVFADLDKNGDGFLDHSELDGILKKIFSDVFPEWDEETTTAVINSIVSAADTDQDGRLSLEEFVRSFVDGTGVLPDAVIENWETSGDEKSHATPQKEFTTLSQEEYDLVRNTFDTMDSNADGLIQREELSAALQSALQGAITSEEQLQRITDYVMDVVDKNSDGIISWAEFKRSFETGQQVLPVALPQSVPEVREEEVEGELNSPTGDEIARPKSPVAEQLEETNVVATPKREEEQSVESPIRNDVSGVAISDAQLRREFGKYDRNGNGFLDRNEFKRAYLSLENYGLVPSQAEIDRLFSKYGKNEKVYFDEFCLLMLTRSKM